MQTGAACLTRSVWPASSTPPCCSQKRVKHYLAEGPVFSRRRMMRVVVDRARRAHSSSMRPSATRSGPSSRHLAPSQRSMGCGRPPHARRCGRASGRVAPDLRKINATHHSRTSLGDPHPSDRAEHLRQPPWREVVICGSELRGRPPAVAPDVAVRPDRTNRAGIHKRHAESLVL